LQAGELISPSLQAKHATRKTKRRLDVLVAKCRGEPGQSGKFRDLLYLWPAQAALTRQTKGTLNLYSQPTTGCVAEDAQGGSSPVAILAEISQKLLLLFMSDSSHATVVPDTLRAQIQNDLCRALSEQTCTHHPLNPAGNAQVYCVEHAGPIFETWSKLTCKLMLLEGYVCLWL